MPSSQTFDVLIVGAGPAGIAAGLAAAQSGARVGLVDDNPLPGGQIYRSSHGSLNAGVQVKASDMAKAGIDFIGGTSIYDAPKSGTLYGWGSSGRTVLHYEKLILAVGARELFLPFPGWTLPNVMGIGGLQAMVKGGLDVSGKRIVLAGTGPLLLAVASYLKRAGAQVVGLFEQAPWSSLVSFSLSLGSVPRKLNQAIPLLVDTMGCFKAGSWIVEASGAQRVESVTVESNGKRKTIACDYVACAYGFVPNLELPMLLGCQIQDGKVEVDRYQRTSVGDVFCAGEPTGIGGVDLSELEGDIAGHAAVGRTDLADQMQGQKAKWTRFARNLDIAFTIRPEIKNLVQTHTIICRCEDVTVGDLERVGDVRSAKLQTRCGMGACQGRICGAATRLLYGWEQGTVRPPLIPVPLTGFEAESEAEN